MGQDHRLQAQRFELKYLISPNLVEPMRDFVRCYLELDDFSAGRANNAYQIHSVYLDSADLHTCQATRNGDKNRFKLRLRYYNDDPRTPVFFEIKQRVDNAILKQRCPVRRDAVPLLMSGQLPDPEHLFSDEPRHLVSLQRFQYLQFQLNAVPRLHNNYLREAWVPPSGNAVRVTFDSNIRVEPYFGYDAVVEMKRPRRIYADVVVLELKFTGRFPNWLREMTQCFNLARGTASKYCGGVDVLGDFHFRPRVEDAPDRGVARAAEVSDTPPESDRPQLFTVKTSR